MLLIKQFQFDAAHQLAANVPDSHKYSRLHGHSFDVELQFSGEPDAQTGWVCDFAEIDVVIADIRGALDHQYLNEIDGLTVPTLEHICMWIWQKTHPRLPLLSQVKVLRGSCQEGCIYTGPVAG
ncbi:MAG: 6-carboxytetrahydropterin synthase [Pseudomonadota bacterium]